MREGEIVASFEVGTEQREATALPTWILTPHGPNTVKIPSGKQLNISEMVSYISVSFNSLETALRCLWPLGWEVKWQAIFSHKHSQLEAVLQKIKYTSVFSYPLLNLLRAS